MKVFLDANVLFSASNRESGVAQLAALIFKKADACTNHYALEEARRNIRAKRPEWENAFEDIARQLKMTETFSFPLDVGLADKDLPILCSAIQAGCGYLVTGDRRDFGFLHDRAVRGVLIVTPRRMAEILLKI